MPQYFCENRDGSLTEVSHDHYQLAVTSTLHTWGTSFEQRVWNNEGEGSLSIIMLQPATIARIPGAKFMSHDD